MSKVTRFTCVLCTKRTKHHDRRFLGGENNKGLRARCCPGHISDENFSEQAIECLSDLRKSTDFNRSDILDLLQKIIMLLLKNDDKRLNFDKDSSLSDAEYISLTGIDIASFNDLATHLVSIRDTKVRSSRTCLGIFLTKMRSGMSNKLLATIFNVGKGKDSIRRAVATVRKNLMQTFVPKHLGFNHISRN
ncbi:unnamed protein product [Mytilus coruscus]|uniref:Uncharacterized protein n=1 Tax=Mytilus coruscus TaxID=42192 RepID=A0A6J8DRD4_MYTCO|nr:unnamed protein product [Mytilus coruscus]